jgi:GT2 family glycosyltransferase
MNICVVILHYRDLPGTRACLSSLERIASPPFTILLIDNGSGDGSGEVLREWVTDGRTRIGRPDWPAPEHLPLDGLPPGVSSCSSPCGRIHFLVPPVNLGFAGGNNLGIRLAIDCGADYIWLLNSDTAVTKGALSSLVQTAGATERVGAVQSLLLRWGSLRLVDSSGQKITVKGVRNDASRPPRKADTERGIPIFGACAASALYDVAALRDVGLFDEEFFIICEDVDLSFRLRLAGYRIRLSPRSVVFHKAGITTPTFRDDPVKFHYGYRNEWVVALRYLSWRHLLSPRALYHALQAAADGRRIGKRFLPFVLRNVPEAFRNVGKKRMLRKRWAER